MARFRKPVALSDRQPGDPVGVAALDADGLVELLGADLDVLEAEHGLAELGHGALPVDEHGEGERPGE